MKKLDQFTDHLRTSTLRVARFHFVYVLIYVVQTIVYHASKLITPDVVLRRWVAVASLLVVTTAVWFISKHRTSSSRLYQLAISAIIFADLAFAAFNVYTQRGYASKSVLLFIVPIVVATVFISRRALFATAMLAIAAYTTVAVKYFVDYFNEGYMVELYGEIAFYSAIFLLVAALLWSTIHKRT
jgi:hypothetical protein